MLKARISTRAQSSACAMTRSENMESVYGDYLDKACGTELADLFAGTRRWSWPSAGNRGQDIRAFLHAFGGAEGPHLNQLGDHLNLQPVIHVSADSRCRRACCR